MKQKTIKLLMLVGVLLCATSAWSFEGRYYAKLTGRTSTTTSGAGKVYVSATSSTAVSNWGSKRNLDDYPNDEQWADWVNGDSNVEYVGSLASADGIDAVASQFAVYARPDAGSYFAGWSFTDGKTDLGTEQTLGLKLTPSKTRATLDPDDTYDEEGNITSYGTVVNYNAKEYVVYATFEPLLIESYSISGSNTTVNKECTQTVTFRILGKEVDVNDFDDPTFVKQTGTGTWAVGELSATVYADYGDIHVPVTFTADDANAGEFSTTLRLRSKAGKTMDAVLAARTIVGGGAQAIRLNKSKVQQEAGDLADLLEHAAADDIIKLNGNYSSAVTINKQITFDLNGYTLSNTLTVSGSNVTLAHSPFGGTISGDVNVTGGKLALNGGTISGEVTVKAGATLEQNGAIISGNVNNNGTLTTTDGKCLGYVYSAGTLNVNGGYFYNSDSFDEPAITVTGGTASINRCVIGDEAESEVNNYGIKATGGEVTIGKLAVINGQVAALRNAGGSITVNGGKFFKPEVLANGEITFLSGYFKNKDNDDQTSVRSKQIWRNTAGPEAREGYAFFAGDQAAAQASNVPVCRIGGTAYATLEEALSFAANHPDDNPIIILENDYTLKAGYYTIPANATLIVPMSNDQETANREVPRTTDPYYKNDKGVITDNRPVSFRKLIFENGVNMEVAGAFEMTGTQYYYSTDNMGIPGGNFGHLIMKPGSHMTVNNGGELRAWGFITGDGTKDGAGNYLSGEIDARRGSTVREMFQMGDWKGGDISFTMIQPTGLSSMSHLFPVYIYFIQNIESPVKYHPGSSLLCAASVSVSDGINAYANDIKVVGKEGEAAMFLMDEKADAENTWVRKYYDAKKDQQVYEVNSGAQLGSMVINLGSVPGGLFSGSGTYDLILDSRKFVLPLTSNFKIHLLSGSMQFTQSTSCLPGMEVEVDKESEISVIPNSDPTVTSGALYFYDADQWSFMNMQMGGYVGNSGKYGAIVKYSATWDLGTNGATKAPNVRNISSPAAIGDAKLIVHGTFRSASGCSVYTTWSKGYGDTPENNPFTILPAENGGTGGASIISTNEDAGTFIFDDASPAFDGVHWGGDFGDIEHIESFGNSVLVNYDHNNYSAIPGVPSYYPIRITTVLKQAAYATLQEQCEQGDEAACAQMGEDQYWTRMYGFELCTPAMLQNGDGSFVATEGSPAGRSYCYMNDHWTSMEVAPENECFMKDNYGVFYAKPAEYVAVSASVDGEGNVVGNSDHTFSDAAGAGRLFILMNDGCQWWEVEKKDNLYHCLHPDNDTYYYWDETEGTWMEQRFNITWLNWDGTEIKSYTTDPVSGDPVEVAYSVTYGTMAEYLGSNPTREPDIDYTYTFTGWSPALGKVTSDVTYTATYEKQQRKYTIIFTEEGGTEIERQFLIHNATPVCANTPTRTGFTLQWEPEVAAVTGDATYRATWLENPPTEYAVTFYDYNGTTILKPTGSDPYMVAVGAMPVRPANPDNKPATKEFTYVFDHWSPALEAVSATSVKSYVAVYREVAKTFTVIFQNEDGSEIERHNYSYGETPVCSATPTKANTAEWTYQLTWTPQIQDIVGDLNPATPIVYRADFETLKQKNKYTVTLQCNLPGKATFTGAGLYDYGTSATIAATPADGYEFVKWQERAGDADLGSVTVNGDITLTAVVKESAKPDPENLTIGIDGSETIASATDYMNVMLTSDGVAHSGQIINANNITLYGNADFVLSKDFAKRTWYCVAVPWRVEANGGIYIGNSTTPAVLGTDIEICYYDGAVRAAQGKVSGCWIYMKNLSTKKILEPGRAYMIALLRTSADQMTFRKKVQEPLLTTETSVQAYPSATTTDANWNAIANPSLFHAFVNAGSDGAQAQRYNSADDSYDWFDLDDHKLVVGEPIYVQAPAAKSIVVANGASYAPARRAKAQAVPAKYEVSVTAAGATRYADHLSITLNEDKEDNAYVIGKDLVKFGVSAKVAQMWIDRYDAKLCVNTVAPEGDATNFPMSLFAPKAGNYTIAIEREVATEEYALYLTCNGEAIWNLSEGAYVMNLEKGTYTNYGLRVSARAPQSTTGIDEAVVDAKGETRKVLINDQVFIIRGDKVYSIDGQLVK